MGNNTKIIFTTFLSSNNIGDVYPQTMAQTFYCQDSVYKVFEYLLCNNFIINYICDGSNNQIRLIDRIPIDIEKAYNYSFNTIDLYHCDLKEVGIIKALSVEEIIDLLRTVNNLDISDFKNSTFKSNISIDEITKEFEWTKELIKHEQDKNINMSYKKSNPQTFSLECKFLSPILTLPYFRNKPFVKPNLVGSNLEEVFERYHDDIVPEAQRYISLIQDSINNINRIYNRYIESDRDSKVLYDNILESKY